MEHLELTSKILAEENIRVQKANVRTASFDLINRILTIPMWENMEPVVEEMLHCHEVAHALYTPDEYVDVAKAEQHLSHIMNVVEDARIELLFKDRYQGTRKVFAAAAKVLRDEDFFNLRDTPLHELNLIDRINVFFKLGSITGVRFSKEEALIVARIQRIVKFEDVIKISREIYELMTKTNQEKKNQLAALDDHEPSEEFEESDGNPEDSADPEDEDDESQEDSDESEDDADSEEEQPPEQQEMIESKTMNDLQRKLEDMTATFNKNILYHSYEEGYDIDLVVTYKTIVSKVEEVQYSFLEDADWLRVTRESAQKFLSSTGKSVSHMVQVFEQNKAADIYSKIQISKSGSLDMGKIWGYKTNDDLFMRDLIVPQGKNHGMVLLLDWSQSMTSGTCLRNSIEQVIQLVMFCRMLQIPHRVLAFSSSYQHKATRVEDMVSLLELFNEKMSKADFTKMVVYLRSNLVQRTYRLHYTPLLPALLYMRKYIPEFKQQHNVQICNLIVYTDGANTTTALTNPFSYGSIYITDKVSKKNYLVHATDANRFRRIDFRSCEMGAVYSMIRDRTGADITTYFIGPKIKEGLYYNGFDISDLSAIASKELAFRRNGFYEGKAVGRKHMYIVSPRILDNQDFSVPSTLNGNMSAASAARAIKTMAGSSKKSKVLVQRFAETIS